MYERVSRCDDLATSKQQQWQKRCDGQTKEAKRKLLFCGQTRPNLEAECRDDDDKDATCKVIKNGNTRTMRTLSPFVFLCAVSTIQSSTSFSQTPTPFPKNFSIDFVTNITDDNKQYPIDGTLYYSWSSRSQRIDHAPGSYECIHFYNTTSSCTLVFFSHGRHVSRVRGRRLLSRSRAHWNTATWLGSESQSYLCRKGPWWILESRNAGMDLW